MGILFAFLAAFFASTSNLCMRKSIDYGGTTRAFLMIQLSVAFLVALLMNPIRSFSFSLSYPMVFFGLVVGLIMGVMMFSLGKALEKGPSGLSFSVLNSSTVVPGAIMALFFGAALGFEYHMYHAIGSMLVLAGLFWGGAGFFGFQDKKGWLFFILVAFFLHVLFLVAMQWKALMMNASHLSAFFRVMKPDEAKSLWFLPLIYLAASFFQFFLFFFYEKRKLLSVEWGYGFFGGVANCICTFFLVTATEVASPMENAMIFPIFSVAIIFLCNSWGKVLYQEKVNWKASQMCMFGVFVGCVDWRALFSFFS